MHRKIFIGLNPIFSRTGVIFFSHVAPTRGSPCLALYGWYCRYREGHPPKELDGGLLLVEIDTVCWVLRTRKVGSPSGMPDWAWALIASPYMMTGSFQAAICTYIRISVWLHSADSVATVIRYCLVLYRHLLLHTTSAGAWVLPLLDLGRSRGPSLGFCGCDILISNLIGKYKLLIERPRYAGPNSLFRPWWRMQQNAMPPPLGVQFLCHTVWYLLQTFVSGHQETPGTSV